MYTTLIRVPAEIIIAKLYYTHFAIICYTISAESLSTVHFDVTLLCGNVIRKVQLLKLMIKNKNMNFVKYIALCHRLLSE